MQSQFAPKIWSKERLEWLLTIPVPLLDRTVKKMNRKYSIRRTILQFTCRILQNDYCLCLKTKSPGINTEEKVNLVWHHTSIWTPKSVFQKLSPVSRRRRTLPNPTFVFLLLPLPRVFRSPNHHFWSLIFCLILTVHRENLLRTEAFPSNCRQSFLSRTHPPYFVPRRWCLTTRVILVTAIKLTGRSFVMKVGGILLFLFFFFLFFLLFSFFLSFFFSFIFFLKEKSVYVLFSISFRYFYFIFISAWKQLFFSYFIFQVFWFSVMFVLLCRAFLFLFVLYCLCV